MPDWRQFVRERLGPLALSRRREEEIYSELAEHLADATEQQSGDLSGRGTDWSALAGEIRRAEEDNVSPAAKTIWVPGTSVTLGAALLLVIMTRFVPPVAWVEGKGPMLLASTWAVAYLAFGAMGAWLSRRAGGGTRQRLLAGVFPVVFHLAVFVLPIVAALASDAPNFPEHRQVSWLLGAGAGWVVIPGIVLAIGTLPFLRSKNHA